MAQLTTTPPGQSDTGLPSNIAASICAFFPLVGGIVFYFIEKKDLFVRHWSIQSIYLGGGLLVVSIVIGILSAVLGHVPLLGILFFLLLQLLNLVINLGGLVLWIIGTIQAIQGRRWEYPVVSQYGKRYFPNLT
ncbi:MAG: DUF4870 domain-containing protein [Verrucomicrobia bacterium]|nr:DUF4870 domain-containing protein [Verrucomicrobiota bacterium]